MYFFYDTDCADQFWPLFQGALLETWRNCGLMKTVVVTNRLHGCLHDFSRCFPNLEIQVSDGLIPGRLQTMSIDCNANLYKRFHTPYVLIVQDDGFPLRRGLESFVGKYDFIGAPFCRPLFWPDLFTRILNYCPSNGGFSLRSQRICKLASEYWNEKYGRCAFDGSIMDEDLFYTQTLPRRHLPYWMSIKAAPSKFSERFSYEGVYSMATKSMPFGFHSPKGFADIYRRFPLRYN